MPGENLTRAEAQERAALLSVESYDIALDLTTGPDTFRSTTTVRFAASGPSTFIDAITAQVHSITLNGAPVDVSAADGSRIRLDGLTAANELTVDADFAYTNTGEGLHRFVDPADGEVYLYSQFEVPDSRRVYPVFEQPDLKATFTFHVTAPSAWTVVSNSPTPDPVAGARRGRHLGLRDHTADLELRHRDHRRAVPVGPLRAHQLVRPRHPARDLRARVALRVHGCRLRLRDDPPGLRVLRGEVRLPVPVREVRPAVRARVQRGRDGERRSGHLRGALRVPFEGDERDQGAPGRHDPARAGPHVVRRSGHHEVVERPLAQRVIRRVGLHDRQR